MNILYVDESGDDGLPENGLPQNPYRESNVFLRTGLAFHDKKWRKINNAFLDLRYKYKIPVGVEVHATEIRRGNERKYIKGKKQLFPNWYGQNFPKFDDRMKIIKDFCSLINDFSDDITLMCVVIDKKAIKQPIISERFLPKNISWELLIERYNLFLQKQSDYDGIIISDAVQDKIEKQQRAFASEIYRNSTHVQESHFIESILFEPSDSSNMLQLADIASYAFFKHFNNNDSELFNIIEPCLLQNDSGIVNGAGIKIWPQEKEI